MKMDKKVNYRLTVRGRVQGVGYRYSAVNMAAKFGINGVVKNLPNGSVYMEIEGSELSVKLMTDWCRVGPGTGRVDSVEVDEGAVKGYTSFRVLY